jgi:hypothetical protein
MCPLSSGYLSACNRWQIAGRFSWYLIFESFTTIVQHMTINARVCRGYVSELLYLYSTITSWYFMFMDHPPYRDNVTAPHGRPNLRSRPPPGGETTKSIRDMRWHWQQKYSAITSGVPNIHEYFRSLLLSIII